MRNVASYGGYVLHVGALTRGCVRLQDVCTLRVDYERRSLIAPNHTITHMMNWALRHVLQTEVDQKGSLVDEQKLRFDFNATKAMTPAQIAEVEKLVNARITAGLQVFTKVVPIEEARRICSLRAVFGEVGQRVCRHAQHYPNMVRVVSIGVPVDELLADPQVGERFIRHGRTRSGSRCRWSSAAARICRI